MTYEMHKTYLVARISKLASEIKIPEKEVFGKFCYSSLFGKDFGDIDEEDIIDDSQDKQVDIIKIDEPTEESATVNIIQTKYSEGFSSTAIIGLNNGLNWIFEKPEKDYSTIKNILLVSKIREIRELLEDKSPSNIEVNVYFITLGNAEDIPQEFEQELTSLKKWDSSGFHSFNFHIWGAKELSNYISESESNKKIINQRIKIDYDVNVPSLIEQNIGSVRGMICTTKVSEIARIIEEDTQRAIFNKNIRKFLGKKKKINQSIYDSCIGKFDAAIFWFLNNGITIICDSFNFIKNPDNPQIEIKNMQIVNGCQTSMTLHSAMKDGKLRPEAKVLVKVYSIQEDIEENKFIDKITLSTNNQNKIGLRELKSNDSQQQDLQKAIEAKYGYFYERKPNEFKDRSIPSNKKIINEHLAQAYLAIGKKQPSIARSRPNYIWGNEDYYDTIFRNPSPARLVFCYKIYEYCNSIKKTKMKEYPTDEKMNSLVSYGALHISRVIAAIFLNSDNLPEDKILDEHILGIEKNPAILIEAYNKSLKLLSEILDENREKYASTVTFLKSNEIQKKINRKLKSSLHL